MLNNLRVLGGLALNLLLGISLIFPAVLVSLKLSLVVLFLSVVFLYLIQSIKHDQKIFSRSISNFLLYLLVINMFFVLLGMVNGVSSEAFYDSVNIYILYPVFYAIVIAGFSLITNAKMVIVTLVFSSICISLIVVAHVLRVEKIMVPGYELLYLIYPDLSFSYDQEEFTGSTGYLPRAMERFVFLAPFAVALLSVWKKLGLNPVLVYGNFILVLVAILMSERMAFLGIFILSGIVILLRLLLIKGLMPVKFLIFGGLLVVVGVLLVTSKEVVELGGDMDPLAQRKYESYFNKSESVRLNQAKVLFNASKDSPLLGAGFGSEVPGYIRNPNAPWRFELTYIALFYQTGVVGLLLYGGLAFQLATISIRSLRKEGAIVLPFIFALSGGMLAASTNPYLAYGSGQIILFLPLAVLNQVLLSKKQLL